MTFAKTWLAASTATFLWVVGPTAAAADCTALLERFDRAVTNKSLEEAKKLEGGIYLDDVCSSEDARAKERIVALEIDLIGDATLPDATRQKILADLRNPAGWLHGWEAAVLVADRLFAQRHFADASEFYDRSISLAGDPSAMSDTQKRDVLGKASAAKMLASDDDQGRQKAQFAATTRSTDGALGGIYARSMRGVVPIAIPLPINFVFNSTEFTPVGEKAAAELSDYLKEQHIAHITLIGHTDSRGGDAYNVKLSEARVQRVADFLRNRGVSVPVSVVGKGWHDPLDVSRLPYRPDQEEVWALNRRVELLR